jgi:hypothetical protein
MYKSESDVAKAKERLEHIMGLFAEAKGVSAKFTDRTEPTSKELAICDPKAQLDSMMFDLHKKMRQLAIERRSKAAS